MRRILVRPLIDPDDGSQPKEEWIDAYDMPSTAAESKRIKDLAEAAYNKQAGCESIRHHNLVRTGPVRKTDHGPWIVGMLQSIPLLPPTVGNSKGSGVLSKTPDPLESPIEPLA